VERIFGERSCRLRVKQCPRPARASGRAREPRYLARWSGGERKVMRDTACRMVDYASQLLTALEIHEDTGYMAKRAM
jgi:hypothetical protein